MDDDRLSLVNQLKEFTGIEDVNHGYSILESNNWDLQAAIESVIACQDMYQYEPAYESQSERDGLTTRQLRFQVKYGAETYPVTIENCFTVGDLKDKLTKTLQLSASSMKLQGWKYRQDDLIFDTDVLRDLNLPDQNNLTLTTISTPSLDASEVDDDYRLVYFDIHSNPINERLKQTFELHIHFVDENKDYIMKFAGTRTIRQVKDDLSWFVGPVRTQKWENWPQEKETLRLADCGINYPIHELKVWRKTTTAPVPFYECDDKQTAATRPAISPLREDTKKASLDADIRAAKESEDVVVVSKKDKTKKRKKEVDDIRPSREGTMIDSMRNLSEVLGGNRRLLPENATDGDDAVRQFNQEFTRRYGDDIPTFFFGSFKAAVDATLTCSAADRRLLVVYVHDDRSALANDFCKKVFCRDEMRLCLEDEFVVWPWDWTSESNRKKFLSQFAEIFGETYAESLKNYQMPILVITFYSRGNFEVNEIIQGNVDLEGALSQLRKSASYYRERQQRDYDAEFKERQDAEFIETERIDREKKQKREEEEARREKERMEEEEQQRRRDEEEKLRKEEEERERLVEEARRKVEDEELEEARRRVGAAEQLENCERTVCVCFQFPDGKTLQHCFRKDGTWQDLVDYLMSEGYHSSRFEIASRSHRKITPEDEKKYMSLTLESLKIHGEKLIVDHRMQE